MNTRQWPCYSNLTSNTAVFEDNKSAGANMPGYWLHINHLPSQLRENPYIEGAFNASAKLRAARQVIKTFVRAQGCKLPDKDKDKPRNLMLQTTARLVALLECHNETLAQNSYRTYRRRPTAYDQIPDLVVEIAGLLETSKAELLQECSEELSILRREAGR